MALKIGDVARRAGCRAETIRYYERENLLPVPERTQGNYRLYGKRHLERLTFIRHCRSLDMTLDEIRALLTFRDEPEKNCRDVNALLDEHIRHVANRISELRGLERQLKSLRRLCAKSQATRNCGIFKGLSQARRGTPRKSGHVHGTH